MIIINLEEIKNRTHNCCTSCERRDLKKDIDWLINRVEELEVENKNAFFGIENHIRIKKQLEDRIKELEDQLKNKISLPDSWKEIADEDDLYTEEDGVKFINIIDASPAELKKSMEAEFKCLLCGNIFRGLHCDRKHFHRITL